MEFPSSSGVRLPREGRVCADIPEDDRCSVNVREPGFMATTDYLEPIKDGKEGTEDREIHNKGQPECVPPQSTPLEHVAPERGPEPEPEPKYELQEPQNAMETEAVVNHGFIPFLPPLPLSFTSLEGAAAPPIAPTTASAMEPPPTLVSSLHCSHLASYEYQQADQQGSEAPSSHDISSLRESEIMLLGIGGSAVVSDIEGWETQDEQGRVFSVLSNL